MLNCLEKLITCARLFPFPFCSSSVCSAPPAPVRSVRTWPRCHRRTAAPSPSISFGASASVSTSCPSTWWVCFPRWIPSFRVHHNVYYCHPHTQTHTLPHLLNPIPFRFQHSTKQSIRLWWQYAYKCVTPSASAGAVWNPNLKFRLYCSRQLRIRKLRRGPWSRRQPLRLHINDIKLMCQVRRRSK